MIIGITGNSGSGKTTFSKLLNKEYNAETIDADKVVRKLSMPGEVYFKEVVKKFGREILLESGEINKTQLSKIIFSDSKKRETLNLLTFKYVVDEIKKVASLSKNKTVIIDAPLLIESNLNKICDIVISVIADKDTKIERICKRDNILKEQALKRISAQPEDEFYLKNSNIVIINNNNSNLEKQIKSIKELLESKIIKSKETVIVQNNNLKIMQFKTLLKYKNISHAFTLMPLDFGSNDTYIEKKEIFDKNYKEVCKLLNIDSKNIIRPYQTHTKNIRKVNNETGIFNKDFIDIDGLITNKKERVLSLTFADCMPIYSFDKEKNIIGNIHSGWQGTTKKIAKEAIIFMKKEYNCNPKDIICVIGPTIRKCHFEVQQEVKDIFYNKFKYMDNIDNIITYNKETKSYFIDTVEINKNLLQEEGILKENISDSAICTFCNSNITHSFRKDGKKSGRNTSIISLI